MKESKMPSRKEWGNPKVDSHLSSAFRLYAGKTIDEAIPYFVSDPFQQSQALRIAPPTVFDYYILCFAKHLATANSAGESDMASVFLNLLVEKSERDPRALARIYSLLKPAVAEISGRQAFYEADQDIYGSFADKRQTIERNLALVA